MLNPFDTIKILTSQEAFVDPNNSNRLLNDFADSLGWRPSERLDVPSLNNYANTHLVVEHGLENSAVITFLRDRWQNLDFVTQKNIVSISYNNLVDWHIQVYSDEITFVYNRIEPIKIFESFNISYNNYDRLRSEAFEQIIGKKPNPNLPALDDALIQTISDWRRRLSVEVGESVPNENLSALFNAIIFVRAAEDHNRKRVPINDRKFKSNLLTHWDTGTYQNLYQLLLDSLQNITDDVIPDYLLDYNKLRLFDNLDRDTVHVLLIDFYRNKYYDYDFSLISQHALSRIYEHYVSLLYVEESPQLSFLPRLPNEEKEKSFGSVYTPQFIARFFARYLREQMPPLAYKGLKSIDPACGSGIFLRTLLELQCDPVQNGISTETINSIFQNITGLDINENAVQAAQLSVSLLHLVLTNRFPQKINIINSEAIKYYEEHQELKGSYDAVIANPPFVSIDTQTIETRKLVLEFMKGLASGRIDMYLAFLKIGIELLKPGGYGLFVLPHSFLLSNSASLMRNWIIESCWIRCLADISSIRVFQDNDTYVILLIVQKKLNFERISPPATIIKCQETIGLALQDAVEGRRLENNAYSIYDVSQTSFENGNWVVLPPRESRLELKLFTFPLLENFLQVKQGFVTGADDVFIIPEENIPQGERDLFIPYLADREMKSFRTPKKASRYVFFPFLNGNKIDENILETKFRKTWNYLNIHKQKLESRSPVKTKGLPWWHPERPRHPEVMLRPKIITPHLVLTPRFSLDSEGRFAVSHSPMLLPKDRSGEEDLLKYFLAILNSTVCYWFISKHSHVYRSGYSMLEPKTLLKTPVPDPSKIPPALMRNLLKLVDERLLASDSSSARSYEKQIDNIVADIYNLSDLDRITLGM